MKKLTNTQKNRDLLGHLLEEYNEVSAIIELGFYENKSPKSYKTITMQALITSIDLETGYCQWEDWCSLSMPQVSINAVYLLDDLYKWKKLYNSYFNIDLDIPQLISELISDADVYLADDFLKLKHLTSVVADDLNVFHLTRYFPEIKEEVISAFEDSYETGIILNETKKFQNIIEETLLRIFKRL